MTMCVVMLIVYLSVYICIFLSVSAWLANKCVHWYPLVQRWPTLRIFCDMSNFLLNEYEWINEWISLKLMSVVHQVSF